MTDLPTILPLGLEGLLVRFDMALTEAGNAAALAFHRDVLAQEWPEVREVAPALTSVAVFYDPLAVAPSDMRARLNGILATRDWAALTAPTGRLWQVPVAFGGAEGPQFEDVISQVGLSASAAIDALCAAPLSVLALGFAPGQPYLGTLPDVWNIPRQTGLTAAVPEGAVVVAVRQVIIFATTAPTGWQQVGWTGFRPFARNDLEHPLRLGAGDRVKFHALPADEVREMAALPDGGAVEVPE